MVQVHVGCAKMAVTVGLPPKMMARLVSVRVMAVSPKCKMILERSFPTMKTRWALSYQRSLIGNKPDGTGQQCKSEMKKFANANGRGVELSKTMKVMVRGMSLVRI